MLDYEWARDLSPSLMIATDVPRPVNPSDDLIDWSPSTMHRVVVGTELTASVLRRSIPGAVERSARLGLALQIAVSLSGPLNGVALGAALLSRAGCSSDQGPVGGAWISVTDSVESAINDELFPPPRPAGVSLSLVLHAAGAVSALTELIDALGASMRARRAIAPLLEALAEAGTRCTDGSAVGAQSRTR
jgi:hypothetical protein